MITSWPDPAGDDEFAVAFDRGRERRLLVLPALFDEANKLRHFTVEVMRRLDRAGIDTLLPDLPGTNESTASLADQTIESWRNSAREAGQHFRATAALAIRGGALLAPRDLPVWRYAPATGAAILRGLLRARVIAAKEAGTYEDRDSLLEMARREGIELAGYMLGSTMVRDLELAEPSGGAAVANIQQAELGGAGLWLRVEPDFDSQQADSLAELVVRGPGH